MTPKTKHDEPRQPRSETGRFLEQRRRRRPIDELRWRLPAGLTEAELLHGTRGLREQRKGGSDAAA